MFGPAHIVTQDCHGPVDDYLKIEILTQNQHDLIRKQHDVLHDVAAAAITR